MLGRQGLEICQSKGLPLQGLVNIRKQTNTVQSYMKSHPLWTMPCTMYVKCAHVNFIIIVN